MKLTVLTYSTLFAGRDGSDDRRAQTQIGLVNGLKPDVFLMFATMRCDYFLASQALAAHAQSYEVIRNKASDMASDHYPVLATFEVPR